MQMQQKLAAARERYGRPFSQRPTIKASYQPPQQPRIVPPEALDYRMFPPAVIIDPTERLPLKLVA